MCLRELVILHTHPLVPLQFNPVLCLQFWTNFSSVLSATSLPSFNFLTNKKKKTLVKNFNSCDKAAGYCLSSVETLLFPAVLLSSYIWPEYVWMSSSPVGFSHLFVISSFFLLCNSWWIRVKMLVSELWLCWMNREVSYGEKHIVESCNEVVQ